MKSGHKTTFALSAFLILFSAAAAAQPRITKMEKLPLDRSQIWGSPRFSPDGKSVYYTTENYDGIWVYSIEQKNSRQITADRGAGFGYAVSSDGSRLTYRRRAVDPVTHLRTDEVVLMDRQSGSASVLDSGRDLGLPGFSRSDVVFSSPGGLERRPSDRAEAATVMLGVEKTKIALVRDGAKMLLDPLKGGSYIWPSLSPDGLLIVAYDMDRGTFVCDLNGGVRAMLGRRDAPAWTHDGRWIISSNEKNDGYRVLSSTLVWSSPDGSGSGELTEDESFIALNPSCSPVENKIVCCTLAGEIYLIDYTEEGR